MDVCKQRGTSDCGLYALAYATTLCEGGQPQCKHYIQKDMQPHLIKCLQRIYSNGISLPFK